MLGMLCRRTRLSGEIRRVVSYCFSHQSPWRTQVKLLRHVHINVFVGKTTAYPSISLALLSSCFHSVTLSRSRSSFRLSRERERGEGRGEEKENVFQKPEAWSSLVGRVRTHENRTIEKECLASNFVLLWPIIITQSFCFPFAFMAVE